MSFKLDVNGFSYGLHQMNGIRTRWSNHSWDVFSIGLDVAFPCDAFMGSNLMVLS